MRIRYEAFTKNVRLLRRNPTDAERALWDAMTKDRRFAGRGFKRQTPIGRHVVDFVSFPLRFVVDLVPEEEASAAAMAHWPLGGEQGSLSLLAPLRARKILVHVNNTNPILREDSQELRTVKSAGVEVSYDGMELEL